MVYAYPRHSGDDVGEERRLNDSKEWIQRFEKAIDGKRDRMMRMNRTT